jgi:hypothetical protein
VDVTGSDCVQYRVLILVCSLFNDAFSVTQDYLTSSDRVIT